MVNRSEGVPFKVVSDFEPAGDQPNAIQNLAAGIETGEKFQTLLGDPGSGKSALLLGRLRRFRGQHWLWRQINHSLRS
ncbi:MAG: hypothetical protein CM15mP49_02290 [Actinomycetota bacterium]|nr:MAG: hypothetical protein CM15mP49_02290 [Actinomycetota bacterium]